MKLQGKHTIFISGLPTNITEIEVTSVFSQFGEVQRTKLKMIKNNKSCVGYGFLECSSEEMLQEICKLPFLKFKDHKIKCEPNLRGETLKSYKEDLALRKLYVVGIPRSATDSDLINIFKAAGEVERAYTVKSRKSNESKHYGFVTFQTVEGAEKALKIKKFMFKKFKLTCKLFEKKTTTKKPKKEKAREAKKFSILQNKGKTSLSNESSRHTEFKFPLEKENKNESVKKISLIQSTSASLFNLNMLSAFAADDLEEDQDNKKCKFKEKAKNAQQGDHQEAQHIVEQDEMSCCRTICCKNYKPPKLPSVQSEDENVAQPILLPSSIPNLARIFLDKEFIKKDLKIAEVLNDRLTRSQVHLNHYMRNNLRFNCKK